MSAILSLSGVGKKYKNFTLDNISFEIPEGSIMGLIGENGAGKTTTIKLILNQIKRDSGDIKVFGRDLIQNETEIKELLGVVLDENFFHSTLNVQDISKILCRFYKQWDMPAFWRYIERFELPRDKRIKELSRGMKMKLSIAAALSHNPKLLILDEATSGLDPIVRNQILDVFLEFIQDVSHGILLSSHITSDLERVADYITFIHKGRLLFTESRDMLHEKYGVLKLGTESLEKLDDKDIVGIRRSKFGCEALVNDRETAREKYKNAVIDDASLEEIMLFHALLKEDIRQ